MTACIRLNEDEIKEILTEYIQDNIEGCETVTDVEYDDDEKEWVVTADIVKKERDDEEEKD